MELNEQTTLNFLCRKTNKREQISMSSTLGQVNNQQRTTITENGSIKEFTVHLLHKGGCTEFILSFFLSISFQLNEAPAKSCLVLAKSYVCTFTFGRRWMGGWMTGYVGNTGHKNILENIITAGGQHLKLVFSKTLAVRSQRREQKALLAKQVW